MHLGGANSLAGRATTYYREHGVAPALSLATVHGPSFAYHRRLGTRSYNPDGIDIFREDWDNLVVLDACRFDVFARRARHLPGRTARRQSRAASTSEFVRANFAGRTLGDVVYVSANPWYATLHAEIDAAVYAYYDVRDEAEERPLVDQMLQTTASARKATKRFPDKRLLIHYGPPQDPLFGPTAEEHLPSVESQRDRGVYEQIRRGDLDIDDAILARAYAETFDAVLAEVESLLPELSGKTVISADHGEMLGERSRPVPVKYYGHAPGLYTEELVTIPWHECPVDDRREIAPDPPLESDVARPQDEAATDDRRT